jgi:hypothetical protein
MTWAGGLADMSAIIVWQIAALLFLMAKVQEPKKALPSATFTLQLPKHAPID